MVDWLVVGWLVGCLVVGWLVGWWLVGGLFVCLFVASVSQNYIPGLSVRVGNLGS